MGKREEGSVVKGRLARPATLFARLCLLTVATVDEGQVRRKTEKERHKEGKHRKWHAFGLEEKALLGRRTQLSTTSDINHAALTATLLPLASKLKRSQGLRLQMHLLSNQWNEGSKLVCLISVQMFFYGHHYCSMDCHCQRPKHKGQISLSTISEPFSNSDKSFTSFRSNVNSSGNANKLIIGNTGEAIELL